MIKPFESSQEIYCTLQIQIHIFIPIFPNITAHLNKKHLFKLFCSIFWIMDCIRNCKISDIIIFQKSWKLIFKCFMPNRNSIHENKLTVCPQSIFNIISMNEKWQWIFFLLYKLNWNTRIPPSCIFRSLNLLIFYNIFKNRHIKIMVCSNNVSIIPASATFILHFWQIFS